MWVCLNDAFFSIVDKECGPDELLVRARRPGDIERVFPGAKVKKSPGTDYLFRAVLPRSAVAHAISSEVMAVGYSNFKNSVRDPKLHDAYAAFWNFHARLQPTPPYSGRTSRRQRPLV